MTTSIPDVKAELLTVLTEVFEGEDVTVINGPRSSATVTQEQLLTIGGVRGTREFSTMTTESPHERYVVDLAASVSLMGEVEQQDATNAALAIYEAAESAIRALVNLNGVAMHAQPTGEFELKERADSNGRHALVEFSVNVTAQPV